MGSMLEASPADLGRQQCDSRPRSLTLIGPLSQERRHRKSCQPVPMNSNHCETRLAFSKFIPALDGPQRLTCWLIGPGMAACPLARQDVDVRTAQRSHHVDVANPATRLPNGYDRLLCRKLNVLSSIRACHIQRPLPLCEAKVHGGRAKVILWPTIKNMHICHSPESIIHWRGHWVTHR